MPPGRGVMVSHVFVVVLLALGGAWAAWRGGGLVVRSLARADDPSASLWLIRGIRGVVVGVAAGALAPGLRWHLPRRGALRDGRGRAHPARRARMSFTASSTSRATRQSRWPQHPPGSSNTARRPAPPAPS